MIMCLGLVAFVLDSMVGVIFVKILNIFTCLLYTSRCV